MSARRRATGAVVALCLLAAGTLEAWSSPEEGRRALAAGRAALARKDWAAARAEFQRAFEADATLLEANMGLAESWAGEGERVKAADAFRGVLAAVEGLPEPTAEQLSLYAATRKRLGQLSRDDAALDALVRRHADALAGLATKWAAKDPSVAAEAAAAVLRLAPDHAKAADLRARVAQGATGKRVAIFNGRDGVGFDPLTKEWSVEEGLLVGNVPQGAYLLVSSDRWSGDFDVLVEARILEPYAAAGPPMVALMGGFVDREHSHLLGCLRNGVVWRQRDGPGDSDEQDHADQPLAKIDPKLTPSSWLVLELRFRGNHVTAHVAGKELGRVARGKERPECRVALNVQCCRAAFRRVEITPR